MKDSNKLVLIKLGGSLITKNKPYTVNFGRLKSVCKEIQELKKKNSFKLIIGNGGGSFPHLSAKKFKTDKGFINNQSVKGQAVVQNDAAVLNRIVVKELLQAGLNAISVQPSSALIASKDEIKFFYLEPVKNYLKHNQVPVVYGDVVADLKKGCTILSTEKLFIYLAKKMRPEKIIIIGRVEGVYDAKKKVIPKINKHNFRNIRRFIGKSSKIDVTGGMLHKIETALEMAKHSKQVIIIGGQRGNLKKYFQGEKIGTVIENI